MKTALKKLCLENGGLQKELSDFLNKEETTISQQVNNHNLYGKTKREYLRAIRELGYDDENKYTFLSLFE